MAYRAEEGILEHGLRLLSIPARPIGWGGYSHPDPPGTIWWAARESRVEQEINPSSPTFARTFPHICGSH